ncbi:MAG: DUF6524 family protein [Paracoccaceae bacterium]
MQPKSALGQFTIRVVACIAIVLLTYNPSGYSYIDWVIGGFSEDPALKAFAGLALFIAYIVILRATFFSIRVVGIVLVALLLLAFGWVLYDFGILDLNDRGLLQWLGLIGWGFILGVGLSWSIIRRRLSGQYSVDDVADQDAQ